MSVQILFDVRVKINCSAAGCDEHTIVPGTVTVSDDIEVTGAPQSMEDNLDYKLPAGWGKIGFHYAPDYIVCPDHK
jgi:hypothetical protein